MGGGGISPKQQQNTRVLEGIIGGFGIYGAIYILYIRIVREVLLKDSGLVGYREASYQTASSQSCKNYFLLTIHIEFRLTFWQRIFFFVNFSTSCI